MKKTISFTKDLEFPTMIGEITEITLEDNLKFVSNNNINGSFFVAGKYKMTEASRLEEDFSFNLPIEIELTQDLELDTCAVSISDFTYEIVDDVILRCNIEVLVEGREVINISDDVEEVERECDGDPKEEKEIEIPIKERNSDEEIKLEDESMEITEIPNNIDLDADTIKAHDIINDNSTIQNTSITNNITTINNNEDITTNSLFSNLGDEDDSFATYSIYIMREGDTLEKIIDKYKINKEILEEYNDLSTITLNSKVIIPNINNEKS